MRGEEEQGRTELVLATAVRRQEWYAGHVLIAVVGSGLLVLLTGLSAGLTLGAVEGDVGEGVGRVVPAALAQLPAVWVLAGVTAAFFGISRRLATAAWAVLVACLLLGQLGEVLGLPDVVMKVSPFAHSPQARAEAITVTPLLALTAVAAALLALGMATFRSRDLAST
jgi:ABC-2 type transport system permease protein